MDSRITQLDETKQAADSEKNIDVVHVFRDEDRFEEKDDTAQIEIPNDLVGENKNKNDYTEINDHNVVSNIIEGESLIAPSDDSVSVARPISAARRMATDSKFDVNLIMLTRTAKTSVPIPCCRENNRRMLMILLSPNDYKKILSEYGGGYGTPCRPELELQQIDFGIIAGSSQNLIVPMLFNSGRCAYILSQRVEDLLIDTLYRTNNLMGSIKTAIAYAADKKYSVISAERQRLWRKFLYIYIIPQLQDKARVEEACNNTAEFSEISDKEKDMEQREVAKYSVDEVLYEDTESETSLQKIKGKKKRVNKLKKS